MSGADDLLKFLHVAEGRAEEEKEEGEIEELIEIDGSLKGTERQRSDTLG